MIQVNGPPPPSAAGPASNSYAVLRFGCLHMDAAKARGLRLYATVNVRITDDRWIQPDFAVLRQPTDQTWVPAENVVLVGEFVSPTSHRRDKIDKPALCAAAGIPYYMTGLVSLANEYSELRLWRLNDNGYRPIAAAVAGEQFSVEEPFKMSFDPIELLDL